MVSHSNLIAHHMILHEDIPYDVKRLISLPMFHLFATSYVFIQPLRYGHKTYVQKRFQLEDCLRSLCKYQIKETYMPPPMMVTVNNAKAEAQNLMQSVRHIGTGAVPISADTINQMRAMLAPGVTVRCMWSMTEIGIVSSFRYGEHDNTGSVGKLMRGVEARLTHFEGKFLDCKDTSGELQVRCPGIMLGYRKVAMMNEDKIWFRTGDINSFRNGKLYCVGRTKELIKVKGWQVAPAELEAVLLQHPEVADVAVRGVAAKDEISEVPRAYIVRRNYQEAASASLAEEMYHFCRSRLASYKALDGGVAFVAEIPRTASGKIQRAKLALLDSFEDDSMTVSQQNCVASPNLQQKMAINERLIARNATRSYRTHRVIPLLSFGNISQPKGHDVGIFGPDTAIRTVSHSHGQLPSSVSDQTYKLTQES